MNFGEGVGCALMIIGILLIIGNISFNGRLFTGVIIIWIGWSMKKYYEPKVPVYTPLQPSAPPEDQPQNQ